MESFTSRLVPIDPERPIVNVELKAVPDEYTLIGYKVGEPLLNDMPF
jgi:hypothetical protein